MSASKTNNDNGSVDYDDVDDIIGIAEQMRVDAEDDISPAELEQIGRELGIEPEYIDRARDEVERRREQEQKKAERARRARKKMALIAVAVISTAGATFGIWSYSSLSSLQDLHAEVEAKRAQVDNVRARLTAIERQFADRPDSLEKDAQLVGSQNRLRVEIQRLNEVAARYNREAKSFPNSLWTGTEELPVTVEMASDLN